MKKILNKTTGRFYIAFSSTRHQPLWSQPFRPSQATLMPQKTAESVVKQLTILEPSLDLQIVE